MWHSLFVSCWRLSDQMKESNGCTETRVKKKKSNTNDRWVVFGSLCVFSFSHLPMRAKRRERTKTAGTVNALRVAWLINLMAAWLVFDATINILGKYIWFMALSISAPCCACRFVQQIFNKQMKKKTETQSTTLKRRRHRFIAFVHRKLFLLFVQRVTHWWCRLFIKLNSLCVRLFFYGCDWFWCGFDDALSFVWLKTFLFHALAVSLINFNTNLVIWFNLRFVHVCGRGQ